MASIFLKKEQSVRKQWLTSLITLTSVYTLSALVFIDETYVNVFIQIFARAVIFWVLFHFAYKKRGTFALGWSMFGTITSIGKSLREFSNPQEFSNSMVLIIDIALSIWWIICCKRLRGINKNYQPKKCQKYLDAMEGLKDGKSLQELNIKFADIVREWPQFEHASSKEYKTKKAIYEMDSL